MNSIIKLTITTTITIKMNKKKETVPNKNYNIKLTQ